MDSLICCAAGCVGSKLLLNANDPSISCVGNPNSRKTKSNVVTLVIRSQRLNGREKDNGQLRMFRESTMDPGICSVDCVESPRLI